LKIVIFGNSGSGKSTLAKRYQLDNDLALLDLDAIAWQDSIPPARKSLIHSANLIDQFVSDHARWVVEGCYADLLEIAMQHANEIIFLNPGLDACLANCRNRPWEPHKYESAEAQNNNLDMLLEWVKQYETRNDEFSLSAHRSLYQMFEGKKSEHDSSTWC